METRILSVLDNSDLVQDSGADKYQYNGVFVPRVNDILSAMLHEDYLMTWSNNIGLYQHKKYNDVLEQAADTGSIVHDAIEHYLKENIVPENLPVQARNAFNSFLAWWEIVSKHDIEILMQEQQLVCKYFGGTLDLLIKVDGKIYLVDFKTSNHSSYKYFLQLSAYAYMLKFLYGIDIDGCLILMLNKKKVEFNELFIDLSQEANKRYIRDCQETFLSLVYAYYGRLNVQCQYNNLFGGK